jgi:hypothetical protein
MYSGSDAVEMSIDEAMSPILAGCCRAGRALGEATCQKIEFSLGEGETKLVNKKKHLVLSVKKVDGAGLF